VNWGRQPCATALLSDSRNEPNLLGLVRSRVVHAVKQQLGGLAPQCGYVAWQVSKIPIALHEALSEFLRCIGPANLSVTIPPGMPVPNSCAAATGV
jgi:hypothetical protein